MEGILPVVCAPVEKTAEFAKNTNDVTGTRQVPGIKSLLLQKEALDVSLSKERKCLPVLKFDTG